MQDYEMIFLFIGATVVIAICVFLYASIATVWSGNADLLPFIILFGSPICFGWGLAGASCLLAICWTALKIWSLWLYNDIFFPPTLLLIAMLALWGRDRRKLSRV